MTNPSAPTNPPNPPDRIVLVRGPVPQSWADQLDHLAVDLRTTRPQLIAKAVALLLAQHGREVSSSSGGAR